MSHTSEDAMDELERYREYLCCLARQQLDVRLRAKVDASDVVNQTLHEAYGAIATVESRCLCDQLAWLRRILANNLTDAIRAFKGPARDVSREISLAAALEKSSDRLEQLSLADLSTPSGRAAKNEDVLRLSAALGRLPEDQRIAVEYHHLQGLSLAETARQMNTTKPTAAGLVYRGLRRLREMMTDQE